MLSEEEKKALEDLKNAVNEPLEVFENVVDTFKLINLDQCRIVLNLIENQQKEIEEKSTIIMAGAEKVKQLEKEIEEYQKCFEDIERHQKNGMQMQKNLWKRLKGEIDE